MMSMQISTDLLLKLLFILLGVTITIGSSMVGLMWTMIEENRDIAEENRLQITENNVPVLKDRFTNIDDKIDSVLVSQARIETKMELYLAP